MNVEYIDNDGNKMKKDFDIILEELKNYLKEKNYLN